MAFQYTKATLKTHLTTWVEGNGADADTEFTTALNEIIQRGETRLYRDMDLDSLDSMITTTTAGTVPEVFKPSNLITERLVVISVASRKRTLQKRSRAWIEMMNSTNINGTPLFYAEYDEDRWFLAPIPAGAYLMYVHGAYRPSSIVDGNDDSTTWFSTRIPDILATACRIEAAEFLEFWGHKAAAEAEYTSKLDDARAICRNMQRADVEDAIAIRTIAQTPTQAPEPPATV